MEFGEMKRNPSNWSNFCMLLRRAGLTASAGLSCFKMLCAIYGKSTFYLLTLFKEKCWKIWHRSYYCCAF